MITSIHAAMAKKSEREEGDKGFTLIELLVVILIIGILAAIAIPVFLGQQDQAKDAAAKSDLGNAKIAMISYATANNGTYLATGAAVAPLGAFGYVASEGVALTIDAGGASFCLEAVSTSTGNPVFHIKHDEGVKTGTC